MGWALRVGGTEAIAIASSRRSPSSAYLRIPRTTVIRRLKQLQDWEMIERRGRYYYAHEKTLNSTGGLRSYQEGRRAVANAARRLSILDTQTG